MPLIALLPAAAFALSGLVLAAHQEPGAAVETRYLCLLGALVLAGAGLLAPRRSRLAAGGALLLAVALWALPPGLQRAAAFAVLLPVALLAALWDHARAPRSRDLVACAGAVLGCGALLRGPELLPATLGAASLTRLALPALAAAAALAWCERRQAGSGVPVAVAVALAGGGFTVAATIALLAALVLASLPPRWSLVIAALGLVAGIVVHRDAQSLRALWPMFVLAPFAWLPSSDDAAASGFVVTRSRALLVGAAGAVTLGAAGVAGGAALLVLEERPHAGSAVPATASLAHAARCALLGLAALAAGYPWLRARPLDAALALLDLHRGWIAALVALAAALLVAGVTRLVPRARHAAALIVATLAAVAILVAMPAAAREALPASGVVLTAGAPSFEAALAAASAWPREVRAVTTLAQSATLPRGTRVATVTLLADDAPAASWGLRAGEETAEWAAQRADLRGTVAPAPIAWGWLPPAGDFFAQAYGARWRPIAGGSEGRAPASSRDRARESFAPPTFAIRVERDPRLPVDVHVSVLRLQVAP